MDRVRIEDLPAVEDLTAEEMEQLHGAGQPSFRPSLEALEERQLMAAHLNAVLPQLSAPVAAASHSAAFDRMAAANTNQVSGTLQQQQGLGAADWTHAGYLKDEASRIVKDDVIGHGDRWMFHHVVDSKVTEVSYARIQVKLTVSYGFHDTNTGKLKTCDIYLNFADFGTRDGSQVYKMVGNRHEGYSGAFDGDIDRMVKDAFSRDFTIKKFDPKAGTVDHAAAQNRLVDDIRERMKAGKGGNTINWMEIKRIDGGFTVKMSVTTGAEHWEVNTAEDYRKQASGTLTVTMKYVGMVDGVDCYTCTDVSGHVTWSGWAKNRPTEKWDGQVSDLGVSEGQFKTEYGRVGMAFDEKAIQEKVNAAVASRLKDLSVPNGAKCELSVGQTAKIDAAGVRVTFTVKVTGNGKSESQEFVVEVKDVGTGLGTARALQVDCTLGKHDGDSLITQASRDAFKDNLGKDLGSGWQKSPLDSAAVARDLFGQCERVFKDLGMKGFTRGSYEETSFGMRLHFQVNRYDGQTSDFTVDVKYQRGGDYHCERAFVNYREPTILGTEEQDAIDRLEKSIGGKAPQSVAQTESPSSAVASYFAGPGQKPADAFA